MMTKRVKEILSHYPGENAGVLSNLARMMMSGRSRRHRQTSHPAG